MKSTVSFHFWTLSLFNDDLNMRPPSSLLYVLFLFVCCFYNDYSNLHFSLNALSPTYSQFIWIQLNICVNNTARCFVDILFYNINIYNSMTRQLKELKGEESTEQYRGLWMRCFKRHAVHKKSSKQCIQGIRDIMALNTKQWYVQMIWLTQLQTSTKGRSMITSLFRTLTWNEIFSKSAVTVNLYICLKIRSTSIWTASLTSIQENKPLLAIRQSLITVFWVYRLRLNRLLGRLRIYELTTLSVLNCILDCSQWLLTI